MMGPMAQAQSVPPSVPRPPVGAPSPSGRPRRCPLWLPATRCRSKRNGGKDSGAGDCAGKRKCVAQRHKPLRLVFQLTQYVPPQLKLITLHNVYYGGVTGIKMPISMQFRMTFRMAIYLTIYHKNTLDKFKLLSALIQEVYCTSRACMRPTTRTSLASA